MTRGASILLVVSSGLLLAGVWWAVSRSAGTQASAPDAHRAESPAGESLSNGDAPSVRTAAAPIVVESEGIAPTPVPDDAVVDPPARDDLRFCARVLDREGRRPVADARVRIGTRIGARPADAPLEVSTDADGRFEVDIASRQAPYFEVRASGFSLAIVLPGAGHEVSETAMLVLLDRAATLTIHLVGAGDIPLPGARVTATTEYAHVMRPEGSALLSTMGIPDPRWGGETDSRGSCTIEGLSPDAPLRLEAAREGRTSKLGTDLLTLRPGEARTIEWRMGGGCRLVGRVTEPSGAAATDVELWTLRADSDTPKLLSSSIESDVVSRTKTDSDGRFAIDDVAAGKWWIGPAPTRAYREAPNEGAIAPFAVVVEILEGALEVRQDLVVHRGLFIRGRVLDPTDAPLPRAAVFGTCAAIASYANVGADDAGAFAFGPLVPGTYDLKAFGGIEFADSARVSASAGDSDVVLRVQLAGILSGTVVDAVSGAPCPATLTLSGLGPTDPLMMLAETRPDGTFHLEGIRPGNYDVAAHADDGRVGFVRGVIVSRAADAGGPVVRVAAGAKLRIRYDGKAKYGTFQVTSSGVILAIDSLQNGTSRTQPVSAGHLVVRFTVWEPTRSQEKEFDLAVGEEKEIAFTDGG
jgi:protocatechuate 3,4-dioxygenase beta subunit